MNYALELAQKRKEEEEQMNRLEGRMLIMLKNLAANNTPKEYTISGLNLGPARCRILSQHVAFNETLTALHLARKGIEDAEGVELAKILIQNRVLRKLELEGNKLGPKSIQAFGRALEVNTTLRVLDIESNDIYKDKDAPFDPETKRPVVPKLFYFIECMQKNQTLLSLNLANCQMDERCGAKWVITTQINKDLIDFEFGFNKFSLDQIRTIQDNLRRNKA
jgi:Leucine Rich repeat